jgi:YggT family protein
MRLASRQGRRYITGSEDPGPRHAMLAVVQVVLIVLDLLWWLVVASAVLSWLYAFNIVNAGNQFVDTIGNFLYRTTEPLYRPIRRVLPNLGGLDLSPLVLLLAIIFLQTLIQQYIVPAIYQAGI